MKTHFTCYIEQSGDRFEAACMDLDISVSARSLDEVKASLEAAVAMYLAAASNEAEPARSRLTGRLAPWHVRLKWRLKVLAAVIYQRHDRSTFEGLYSLPCPA